MAPGIGAPGRGHRPGDPEDGIYGDPDNPWEVAEGVPPVIEPATEQRPPDPGPGVIGMSP